MCHAGQLQLDGLVTSAGVQVFISDVRSCSNKEQEQLRVDKELGKIRKKFASGNVLSGINRAALVMLRGLHLI